MELFNESPLSRYPEKSRLATNDPLQYHVDNFTIRRALLPADHTTCLGTPFQMGLFGPLIQTVRLQISHGLSEPSLCLEYVLISMPVGGCTRMVAGFGINSALLIVVSVITNPPCRIPAKAIWLSPFRQSVFQDSRGTFCERNCHATSRRSWQRAAHVSCSRNEIACEVRTGTKKIGSTIRLGQSKVPRVHGRGNKERSQLGLG